jgi:flavin-dependent dehydrogenase
MNHLRADVVICGAGIAGISAAYHLSVQGGVKEMLLLDERPRSPSRAISPPSIAIGGPAQVTRW